MANEFYALMGRMRYITRWGLMRNTFSENISELSHMTAVPNMVYDTSGDYFELFANSDAMIHDCSSFIGEYLFTGKPCCYMLKSMKDIKKVMNPMGVKCMENYYKAFDRKDILKFIDDVVVAGQDPMKEARERFCQEELKFNKVQTNGSLCHITAIFGMMLAGEVVKRLAGSVSEER